jgi:uncharacterized glyoxalase superfamily protein PhnB
MTNRAVPMIHVPDVRATVDWYQKIGFTVNDTYGNDGDGLSFAVLSFGVSQVMFNQGGGQSSSKRREVDLYLYTDDVDDIYERLKDRVDVVEKPHDTFYGMREFILRDLNRFWITFGQESVFARLMSGVQEGDIEVVSKTLEGVNVNAETLSSALATLNKSHVNSAKIQELLLKAGAQPAPEVDAETLKAYAGRYKQDEIQVNVTFEDGQLFAAQGIQAPMRLLALDNTTFRPIYFDNFGTISFELEDGKTIGCTLRQLSHSIRLMRVESGSIASNKPSTN